MIPPDLLPALALETTQRAGGVALCTAEGRVYVERFAERRGRDDVLLPAIDRVTAAAGLEPAQLRLVAVSVGPGGFTGVRIGVTTARMIAEVTGAVIAAVPTAIAIAHTHEAEIGGEEAENWNGDVVVILAVKRDTFWASRLRPDPADPRGWTPNSPPAVTDSAGLSLDGVTAVIADEHLPGDARDRCSAAGVRIIEPRLEPEGVLAAAPAVLARDQATDPLRLEPVYPRPPEAVSLWERRHGVQ